MNDALNGASFLLLNNSSNGLSYVACANESLNTSERDAYVFLGGNPYANVLYDSVWAIACALNRSLRILQERNLSLSSINIRTNQSHARSKTMDVLEEQLSQLSLQGSSGPLNFSHSTAAMHALVNISQFQNGQPVYIGSYTFPLNQLLLNKTMILGEIPTDTLTHVYILYPTYVTVILFIVMLVCFALTFISMCLYFFYLKHPSVKATSSTLSLCLFIGCYFLLASSCFHTISSGIIQRRAGMY